MVTVSCRRGVVVIKSGLKCFLGCQKVKRTLVDTQFFYEDSMINFLKNTVIDKELSNPGFTFYVAKVLLTACARSVYD